MHSECISLMCGLFTNFSSLIESTCAASRKSQRIYDIRQKFTIKANLLHFLRLKLCTSFDHFHFVSILINCLERLNEQTAMFVFLLHLDFCICSPLITLSRSECPSGGHTVHQPSLLYKPSREENSLYRCSIYRACRCHGL